MNCEIVESLRLPTSVVPHHYDLELTPNMEKSSFADFQDTCFKAALQDGNEETLEKILSIYRRSTDEAEKENISRAISASNSKEVLRSALWFAVSQDCNTEEAMYMIIGIATNPNGREIAWEFFKNNYSRFDQGSSNRFLWLRMIKFLIENFNTAAKAMEVELFFRNHRFQGTERIVKQGVESIRINAAWLKRDLEPISKFLNDHDQLRIITTPNDD